MSTKKHVFSQLEKKLFLNIVKKYFKIVENKETDGVTLKKKNDAWDCITREYNASPYATAQSTSKQLRRLWMNLKQRQRDALTKKRHRVATGRGPSTSDAVIDPDILQVTPALIVGVDEAINTDIFSLAETESMELGDEDSQPIMPTPGIPVEVVLTSAPAPGLASAPTPAGIGLPQQTKTSTPLPIISTSFQRKINSILEKKYQGRCKRAEELHEMEMELLRQKIREAKAKADLAELILQQQRAK